MTGADEGSRYHYVPVEKERKKEFECRDGENQSTQSDFRVQRHVQEETEFYRDES